MIFGRRGLRDRTEKAVGKGREAQDSEREGSGVYTFVYFSRHTTEKSYDGEGVDRKGVNCRLLERTFSASKGSFFFLFLSFSSGMKKRELVRDERIRAKQSL